MNVIASAEGSLYELVCRGKKDTYFFGDFSKSKYIFDNTYGSELQTMFERRIKQPKTGVEFGRTIEFDVEAVGDVIKSFAFLIDLPSWFPTIIESKFGRSIIKDLSGVSYGYVKGIAYFLFESIQLYQDSILIQQFSGDSLLVTSSTQGTYAERHTLSVLSGMHDGSPKSIGKNAIPGQLRLTLPFAGCQAGGLGFPIRAMMSHTFTIKCKLRKLEHLVEASDQRNFSSLTGYPWNRSDFTCITDSLGTQTNFTTLKNTDMKPLSIQLETVQTYVTKEMQTLMMTQPLEIPFYQTYENIYTLMPSDYTSSGVKNLRLDGCHPTPRILWIIRSESDMQANLLWKLSPSKGGPYYNTASLVIAGKTRESEFDSSLWRDIVNFCKEDIDTTGEVNTMNWGLGYYNNSTDKRIDGTINMTTADRPTLSLNLTLPSGNQLPPTGVSTTQDSYKAEIRIITEGWTSLKTSGNGRVELLSFN
jgi:hypothetical protein